jgi:hypothetical protein
MLCILIQCFQKGESSSARERTPPIKRPLSSLIRFSAFSACIHSRKKSSSVKKNMQILHGILSSQDVDLSSRLSQEEALLTAAYAASRLRVVVKRPSNAPPLGHHEQQMTPTGLDKGFAHQCSYSLNGPVNRWDVYVKTA